MSEHRCDFSQDIFGLPSKCPVCLKPPSAEDKLSSACRTIKSLQSCLPLLESKHTEAQYKIMGLESEVSHFEAENKELESERDRLTFALADWLTCWDTPEEWMRCRDNAKNLLGGFEEACKIARTALEGQPEVPNAVTVWGEGDVVPEGDPLRKRYEERHSVSQPEGREVTVEEIEKVIDECSGDTYRKIATHIFNCFNVKRK